MRLVCMLSMILIHSPILSGATEFVLSEGTMTHKKASDYCGDQGEFSSQFRLPTQDELIELYAAITEANETVGVGWVAKKNSGWREDSSRILIWASEKGWTLDLIHFVGPIGIPFVWHAGTGILVYHYGGEDGGGETAYKTTVRPMLDTRYAKALCITIA